LGEQNSIETTPIPSCKREMGASPGAWFNRHWAIGLMVLVAIVLIGAMSVVLPPGIDWRDTFRPAARELFFGRNPYKIVGFYYPTWSLLPLIPLAVLPEQVGRAVLLAISMFAFGFTAYRLGARPVALSAFMLSPPVIHCLLNANIDWMPLVGFVLPPQIGLFLVVIKPQVGSAVALFWFVQAWRKGGLWEVVRVFGPATAGLLLSFAVFGLWPLRFERTLGFWWNASLWPASIPVGLALLVAAIRKRKAEYAMAAAPCLSPYVLLHSWAGALVSIVSLEVETLSAVVGLWILVVIRMVS